MNNDLISRSEFRRSLIIWAEKLHIAGECGGCEVELMQAVIRMLDAQATVDAEPMRHGKWLYVGYGKPDAWDCSECSVMVAKQHFYCPRCGARMDGGTYDDHRHDHQ